MNFRSRMSTFSSLVSDHTLLFQKKIGSNGDFQIVSRVGVSAFFRTCLSFAISAQVNCCPLSIHDVLVLLDVRT